MARTESRMLALGAIAPNFELPDPSGKMHELQQGKAATLVMFICNHCPFVKHVRGALAALGTDYMSRGVAIYAINSNDASTHPEDSPAKMQEEAARFGYDFPYLVDADQAVAKAFEAACTPDFFVFDKDLFLVYRGQLDGSRPGNGVPVTGEDLRAALDAVLAGKQPAEDQVPSVGCNIKWSAGNAPSWFD
ncbi:MAG: thioredoxin family protein [Woeseia sp.]|nr:thioredoxin family protein [Woeseia sp.]MBT8096074.1 thioredoxin family protein [Woeseia sp.]NNE62137.1 thioredoxin family protein [Woeseia sp.]NNL54905.1 thioredoxin family protein [Woeseia sp.]